MQHMDNPYSFMHLDALVNWIVKGRLVNELRAALQEQGMDTGEA